MKELQITLPYPVSVNRAWRQAGGRIYLNPLVKRYRQEVWVLLFNKIKFGAAKIRVEIKMFPPDKRHRDIDNIMKVLLDSLQHAGTIDNDSQIAQLYIEKLEVRAAGEVEITIKEIL
jgi:crossover junction endodeoxyribonuclease RusA